MRHIDSKVIAILLIAIAAAGAGYVFTGGGVPFQVSGSSFTPIYCDIYEWRACGYKPQGTESARITAFLLQPRQNFICNSDRCDVEQITEGVLSQLILNSNQKVSQLPLRMKRGDGLAVDGGAATIQWRPWRLELRSCGSSSCSFNDAPGGSGLSGVFIAADSCTFITDDAIYGPQGQVLRDPAASSISYTIPVGESYMVKSGRQTICGQRETQCSSDDDCRAGRPYVYNGKGAEVSNGNLLVYSCNSYGTAPTNDQLNVLPIESQSYFQYGKRCESSIAKTGVCTPGSNSCGSNAVCDVTTFTCKAAENVACRSDAECGSGEFYDMSSKSYFKNVCLYAGTSSSRCSRQQTRSVECAYGSECPQGYYCDASAGRCKQNTLEKTTCPTACCKDDARYFDKPAPSGNVCCPGGERYAPTLEQCSEGASTGGGNYVPGTTPPSLDWLPWLLVGAAAAVLGGVIYKKRRG